MTAVRLVDILHSEGPGRLKAIKLFDHLVGGLAAWILPRRRRWKGNLSLKEYLPAGALRFLVIRPGGLGDAVFLLPVIRRLREGGHDIDILCERRNVEVFHPQEGLCRKIFRYDAGVEFRDVFKNKYDVVVDTEQWHHLSAIAAYFASSHVTIGFATRPSRARLFDVRVEYDVDEYELKSFTHLFELFGIPSDLQLKGCYHLSSADQAWAKDAVSIPYIALGLGGSIALRQFTVTQVSQICVAAMNKGCGVALLGGRDAARLAQDVTARVNDKRVLNFAGQTSLSHSAALIAGAKCFVGHDSGLMHIAGALGVPTVAVFGPGNVKKWGPKGVNDIVVLNQVPCSPCTRFGYTVPTCGGRYPCVQELDADRIIATLIGKI